MKNIKEKWPLYLVNLLSGLALVYLVFVILSLMHLTGSGVITDVARAYTWQEDPDSLYVNSLDDLPHREYRRQMDSINFIQRHYKDPFVRNYIGRPIGIGVCRECDTCTYTDRRIDYFERETEHYYLLTGGFTLPDNGRNRIAPPVFYKKQGVSYMKSLYIDTLQTGPKKGTAAVALGQ